MARWNWVFRFYRASRIFFFDHVRLIAIGQARRYREEKLCRWPCWINDALAWGIVTTGGAEGFNVTYPGGRILDTDGDFRNCLTNESNELDGNV